MYDRVGYLKLGDAESSKNLQHERIRILDLKHNGCIVDTEISKAYVIPLAVR
jgi:hypothetical protein